MNAPRKILHHSRIVGNLQTQVAAFTGRTITYTTNYESSLTRWFTLGLTFSCLTKWRLWEGVSHASRVPRRLTIPISSASVPHQFLIKQLTNWLYVLVYTCPAYHQDQIFNTFLTVQSICPCHQYIPRYTRFSQYRDISMIAQFRHADCLTTSMSTYFSPILLGSDFSQLSSSEIHLSILFVVPDIHSVQLIQRWLSVLTKPSGLLAV